MTAQASSLRDRSDDRPGAAVSAGKQRRGPVFPLSREEVLRQCRENGHDMLCAGEVLALMDLMHQYHYSILELHERSQVSRSMIHDFLAMEKIATNDLKQKLAQAFGMETFEFEILSFLALRAEVSL